MKRFWPIVVTALCAALVVGTGRAQSPTWLTTWKSANVGRPQVPPPPGPPEPPSFMEYSCPPAPPRPAAQLRPAPGTFTHFANQTLRQITRIALGGRRVRVLLSNEYGTTPLAIGAGWLALRSAEEGIKPGGARLTFDGRPTVTIPPGAMIYSDAVDLAVPDDSDVAIDLYLPNTTDTASPVTMHIVAAQTSYVSQAGNHAGATRLPLLGITRNRFFLGSVEVQTAADGAVVVIGDSITDWDVGNDTNTRWTNFLQRRLRAEVPQKRLAVLNSGIGGNRILSDGDYGIGPALLARFDKDALAIVGVTHVIVLAGITDIGRARDHPAPTVEDIVAGHKQLIERARARRVKILGGTLLPYWGAGYYTEVGEAKRQAVNTWIRTSRSYDGVIDFDAALRDPGDPKRLLPAYDRCDHLHPSEAGYRAMAQAVDLALIR
jgi:lysophospholipase L1-like esterase